VAFGVEVEVKDTGSVASKETVQLYIFIPDSAEPPKLLRGFEKVYLVDFLLEISCSRPALNCFELYE
jgi:hypothetical protein